MLLKAEQLYFIALLATIVLFIVRDEQRKSHFWQLNADLHDHTFQLAVLAAFLFMIDYFVLLYHRSQPNHPKFVLLPLRRFFIRMHVISGCIELFACYAGFFSSNPWPWALAAASSAIVGHGPSSLYQTLGVFGQKSIMVPCYGMATLVHMGTAVFLLLDPTSVHRLLMLLSVLHTYAWVRLFYFFFYTFGWFQYHAYSVAVLLAGHVMMAATWPPVLLPCLTFAIVLYNVVVPCLARRCKSDLWTDDKNHEHGASDTPWELRFYQVALFLELSKAHDMTSLSQLEISDLVFEMFDSEQTGIVRIAELQPLLKLLQVNMHSLLSTIAQWDQQGNGLITKNEFYDNVWQQHGRTDLFDVELLQALENDKLSYDARAKFVFNLLDTNRSGTLSNDEVDVILTTWGMTKAEAGRYMRRFDTNHDGSIDQGEFAAQFRPLVEFAFRKIKYCLAEAQEQLRKVKLPAPQTAHKEDRMVVNQAEPTVLEHVYIE